MKQLYFFQLAFIGCSMILIGFFMLMNIVTYQFLSGYFIGCAAGISFFIWANLNSIKSKDALSKDKEQEKKE